MTTPLDGPSRTEVLHWLEGRLQHSLSPADQADVLRATGTDGDAAFALMSDFAVRFGIDMSGYRWDLHHSDRPRLSRLSWPVAAPPPCGVILPLSVSALHAAAVSRRWPLTYPAGLGEVRSHAWVNWLVPFAVLPALTALLVWVIPGLF